jgi:hypothetical protein
VVAVGNLDKVWFEVPEYVAEESLYSAFHSYFGAEWAEVLDAADNSFAYNVANNAYFAVRDLRSIENITLDQLIDNGSVPNIIIS